VAWASDGLRLWFRFLSPEIFVAVSVEQTVFFHLSRGLLAAGFAMIGDVLASPRFLMVVSNWK
jgi:hypothetical protein